MKWAIAAMLAMHALTAAAQQTTPAAEPTPQLESPVLPFSDAVTSVVTDAIIKKAVRETVAEDPHPPPAVYPQDAVLRATTAQSRMSSAFEQAKVPSCLHDDALRLQPATIGPINVVGPLSLPWIISAAMRGKCR
jgi:hypothetical protein